MLYLVLLRENKLFIYGLLLPFSDAMSSVSAFLDTDKGDIRKAIELLRVQQNHPELSESQIAVVTTLIEGKNSINQLPTGSGKTWPVVCLPSVIDILRENFKYPFPSETRVLYVIPLVNIYHSVSLEMKRLNVPFQVMKAGSDTMVDKSVKVVFISPERLQNKAVIGSILKLKWSCVSIDEPHLALEWGISKTKHLKPFREAFSKLNNLNSLGTVFEMHSATIDNIGMLCQLVGRRHSPWTEQLQVPERPNLTYFLYHGKSAPENILQLPIIVKSLENEDEEGITLVYVQSVKEGSDIYVSLLEYCEENHLIKFPTQEAPRLPVDFLHSNLTEDKKKEIIEKAISCKVKILIATSALGAGINIPIVRFVGWGLDRNASGLIQSQGRTARKPFGGEGIVIWVHNPRLHGQRLSASSKVRELLQTKCLRRTSNSWFNHGLPLDLFQKVPELCCSICMEGCIQKSGCETCEEKLNQFKPNSYHLKYAGVEKCLANYLKSLPLNHVTPDSAPEYSEESLAQEIVRNLSRSQDFGQTTDFLSIFSLGAQVTDNIIKFLRDTSLSFDSAHPHDYSSESSESDSEVDILSDLAEYTESGTSEDDTDQELSLSGDGSQVVR